MKVYVLFCNEWDKGNNVVNHNYVDYCGLYTTREEAIKDACLHKDCDNESELPVNSYKIFEDEL